MIYGSMALIEETQLKNANGWDRYKTNPWDRDWKLELSSIVGKTVLAVEIGTEDYNGDVVWLYGEDFALKMYHYQDCCESVYLEDVNGDWNDLIDTPMLVAEERAEDEPSDDKWGDIAGWTFYTFRTIKGSVDLRWYGSSNGYYSIGVNSDVFVKKVQ